MRLFFRCLLAVRAPAPCSIPHSLLPWGMKSEAQRYQLHDTTALDEELDMWSNVHRHKVCTFPFPCPLAPSSHLPPPSLSLSLRFASSTPPALDGTNVPFTLSTYGRHFSHFSQRRRSLIRRAFVGVDVGGMGFWWVCVVVEGLAGDMGSEV